MISARVLTDPLYFPPCAFEGIPRLSEHIVLLHVLGFDE